MQKQPGCFSRFGCFSLCVILAALLFIAMSWQHTDPSLLPRFSLPISLPSLLSHSIDNADPSFTPSPFSSSSHGPYRVTGAPTISAHFIDEVLAFYHSPAVGLGKVLYADGIQYGIDPIYALAFFQHESQFGRLGVARVTLSLGNLRCMPAYPCDNGYARFASWQQSALAWYRLIRTAYVARGLVTLSQIIPVYAPSVDGNNVAAYMAAVEHDVDTWREGRIQL